MPGDIIEGLSQYAFEEEVADEEMVRPFRTTFYFYAACACATNACMGRGRSLSLPVFLPYKRSTVWNERMERLARPQSAKMDRCYWRFHRHLPQQRRQRRFAGLYLHGRSPYIFPWPSAQVDSLRIGSIRGWIRSPYISSERGIPQDHVHERRVCVGWRRRGAVETQAQVGPASV